MHKAILMIRHVGITMIDPAAYIKMKRQEYAQSKK